MKRASVATSEMVASSSSCNARPPLFQLYAIGLPCVPQPAHLPAQSPRHCGLLQNHLYRINVVRFSLLFRCDSVLGLAMITCYAQAAIMAYRAVDADSPMHRSIG